MTRVAGEIGYGRALPEGNLLGQLLAHARSLTLAERVGLVADLTGLVHGGEVASDVPKPRSHVAHGRGRIRPRGGTPYPFRSADVYWGLTEAARLGPVVA